MIATIERNGTKVSVDHTRSWYPNYQSARNSIRDGSFGGLTRSSPMGGRRAMLFRNGTHVVDAISATSPTPPRPGSSPSTSAASRTTAPPTRARAARTRCSIPARP
ncbi:MAG: hypothetical protein U0232_28835 [Thermomicrobiales bacterium]